MNEYLEKLRSIGVVKGARGPRETVERHVSDDGRAATVKTVEHADGRRDATITPDTVSYETVTHKTGKNKGKVAEIRRRRT